MGELKNIFRIMCCLIGIFQKSFAESCITPNSGVYGVCRDLEKCNSLKDTLERRFYLNVNYNWQTGPQSTQMTIFLTKYKNLCKQNKVCCGDLLPFESCGDTSFVDKIVSAGGKATKLDEFIWMAVLQYKNADNNIISACGGSLISKKYVLTAAHCIQPKRLTLDSIVLGEHTKGVDPDCKTVSKWTFCSPSIQTILVESYVMHADYNIHSKVNDIALIRLATDADTSQANVGPICIAPPNTEPDDEPLTVTGWGNTEIRTSTGFVASNVLLKIEVRTVPQTNCQEVFNKTRAVVTEKQFCAGNKRGVETCAGDSGGPAFNIGLIPQYDSDPKFIQYGIVSFSKRADCGENDALTMYTKVSSYYNWILDNMQP